MGLYDQWVDGKFYECCFSAGNICRARFISIFFHGHIKSCVCQSPTPKYWVYKRSWYAHSRMLWYYEYIFPMDMKSNLECMNDGINKPLCYNWRAENAALIENTNNANKRKSYRIINQRYGSNKQKSVILIICATAIIVFFSHSRHECNHRTISQRVCLYMSVRVCCLDHTLEHVTFSGFIVW